MTLRLSRGLRFAAAVALAATVVGACSDDDDATPATTAVAGTTAGADDRADWPSTLRFAAVPAENAEDISQYVTHKIIADELGGVTMEFVQAADYAGVIEGMIAERVDLGAFGPFSYVISSLAGAEIDVVGIWGDENGNYDDYRSYLVVPVGSDIREPSQLAGKTVCFVDPGSTSGFLFPSAALLAEGLDPSETSTDITPIFAGSHDASALAVKNGDCDAGFAYDTMVTRQLIESGDLAGVIDSVEDENVNPDAAELDIIWKSTPIAAPPLAIGTWLPQSMQDAIAEIVTTKVNVDWATANGYCESTDNCPLSDGPFWGYLAGDDSYFDGIRELCRLTGSPKCKA